VRRRAARSFDGSNETTESVARGLAGVPPPSSESGRYAARPKLPPA
jgi:hypothetical protein